MFEALFSENKLAEIDFRDPEKFRSIPSLALPAICFLDDYLTKDMIVGEWGSGASTIFFAERCKWIASTEHSPEWRDKIDAAWKYRNPHDEIVGTLSLRCMIMLVEPEPGFDPDYASQQPGYETVNFKKYVKHIGDDEDDFYDLILVDGRARCACLKAAQPKLKPGGILMLDDSARSIYQWAIADIDWPVRHFEGCIPFFKHGHTVRTTIWVKP